MLRQEVDLHHRGVGEKRDIMDPWHIGNIGTPADVDENVVGFKNFIVDHDSAGRLKAGMALDDRAVSQSSQPFLYASVRPSGNRILACFHTLHIDAHIAGDSKTIFGASMGNVGCIRAGNHRLCRDAARVHTGAAKLVTFDDGDCLARTGEPRRQGRACLARPDDDGVEMLHCGNSLPDCSAAMYSAYQSGQFASRCPVRFSCCPWAASARRSALARSLADAKFVDVESMRPDKQRTDTALTP